MKRFKKLVLTLGLACAAGLSGTILASCKEDTVQITYNTNGGESISVDSVDIGATHDLPTPVRVGYEFEGWYLTEDFSGDPVTTIVAESDVTYYAKWTQLQTITLELDGGTMAETTLYLKAGENLYEYMQNYTPEKSGLQFGAWFKDGVELSTTAKMPEGEVTLTAKYKVAYTVERYTQNLENDEYTKVEVVEYDYVGTTLKVDERIDGFSLVTKSDTVAEKTLSANATENVLKVYYDREVYTVIFQTSYPNASQAYTSTTVTKKFGADVEVPSDYAFEGYCLVGWSETEGGDVKYEANYIESVLYGNSDEETEPAKFQMPARNMPLYAVWQKGYTDMFGGDDYIYVFEEKEKVYLARGDVFFEGEYDAYNSAFYFMNYSQNENGIVTIEGKLYENSKTFAYKRTATSAKLFDIATNSLLDTTLIYFDQYNGLTYSEQKSTGGTEDSKGTFEIDENGDYVVTFTEGVLSGTTRTFRVSEMPNEQTGVNENGFLIRNEEDIELGKLISFGITADYQIGTRGEAYTVEFDGFGTASFNTGSAVESYSYSKDENGIVTLKDQNDNLAGTICIRELEGYGKGYFFYNEDLDRKLTLENGATLEMDGLYNVTYTKNGATVEGYYTSASSVFGGTIVSFEADGVTHKFMVTSTSVEVPGEDGALETVPEYDVEEKLATYAEYYYKDESSIYYAPMLVIDETEAGRATLYAYSASRVFIKISEGTYISDSNGLFVYRAENYYDAGEAYTEPFDLSTISSFVFDLDTSSYAVNYWYSSVNKDNEETKYDVDYTGEDGSTLKLVGGFAFYTKADETEVVGTYTKTDDILTITENKSGMISYYYLKVTDTATPYEVLEYAPYRAYLVDKNGQVIETEYLYFSGKNGVTYTIVTPGVDGAEDTFTEYAGTFAYTDTDTAFGDKIYKFDWIDGTDRDFNYLPFSYGNTEYFAPFNSDLALEYLNDAGRLVIDGYSYKARYNDGRNTYEGNYYIEEENSNVIVLFSEEQTYYFDLTADSFTVRGTEYGTYLVVDNGYLNGLYFELDGYGGLSVYKQQLKSGSDSEYEKVYVTTEKGEYVEQDGIYTFTYMDGTTPVAYACMRGNTYGDFETFVISNDNEVVQIYVNEEDWSILILDAYGNATKYNEKGQKETGSYTLVTDTLLYFSNDALDDACIYEYSVEKGEATPISLTKRGYYTADLKSLLFTEYGFVIVNGDTANPYYYNFDAEGNVVMYKHDASDVNANAYGFVAINDIGKFGDEEVFEGKTYFRNSGYDISFERAESETTAYPLISKTDTATQKVYLLGLDFTPSGAEEFEVRGDAIVKIVTTPVDGEETTVEQTIDCYVTRTVDEEGNVEMYATVNGYFRFYITLTYAGAADEGENNNNTLTVTGLRSVLPIYSYRYLDILYRLYAMGYSSIASTYGNSIGFITLNEEFLANGESSSRYVTGVFGEGSQMYDINGEIVSFTDATYTLGEESGTYIVEFEANDGYTYRLHFIVYTHSAFGAYGYYVSAFTRVQTLTTGAYTLETEKIIATERSDLAVGDLYTLTLKKNGTLIENERFIKSDDNVIFVSKADANGKKVYYTIELVDDTSGSVETNENIVALYKSATVTEEAVKNIYSQDGKLYVDISEESNEVLLIQMAVNAYTPTSSTYDAATATYTVETTAGITFYVKVVTEGETTYVEISEE